MTKYSEDLPEASYEALQLYKQGRHLILLTSKKVPKQDEDTGNLQILLHLRSLF